MKIVSIPGADGLDRPIVEPHPHESGAENHGDRRTPRVMPRDAVTLSEAARSGGGDAKTSGGKGDGSGRSGGANSQSSAGGQLSESEQQAVSEMRKRDQEVKRHEQAHVAVGGPYAGAPNYEYERGPDGKMYAVSGEVAIDAAPEQDPRATIHKMETVVRAALAPSDPSAQDRMVAAKARQEMLQAEVELRQEEQEKRDERLSGSGASSALLG